MEDGSGHLLFLPLPQLYVKCSTFGANSGMKRFKQNWQFFHFFLTRFNPLLAILVMIDEWRGEARYQLNTTGFEEIRKLPVKSVNLTSAFSYMPSNYVLMEKAFSFLNQQSHNGSFLDIGCGKGRALVVAAAHGYSNITGIELIEAYCRTAQANAEKYLKSHPGPKIVVHCLDAAHYRIPTGTQTIFLYNPFNETVLESVVDNIMASIRLQPRVVYVIYLNPLFREKFMTAGFQPLRTFKRFGYLEAAILKLEGLKM
jgi:SAM-dependent methyltransferase